MIFSVHLSPLENGVACIFNVVGETWVLVRDEMRRRYGEHFISAMISENTYALAEKYWPVVVSRQGTTFVRYPILPGMRKAGAK